MNGRAEEATTRRPEETSTEAWLEPVRWFALALFVALPVYTYLVPQLGGRVVWTVAVAGLPLVIVIAGYHRWRRICPLAWFSQLPIILSRPGERRASAWLQANYYYITFSFFMACLWLRLIAINGHGTALAAFLILISLLAFVSGTMFTGKTWCNYICPLSFIEKIYTEPRGIQQTPNSQCPKCTACKPACPDINQENGYWKEVLSEPKRFVYSAFPGLVLAFYFYFYLQSGSWAYYFSGSWGYDPTLPGTAFQAGHDPKTAGFFFLPLVPRAIAALLTLIMGALMSLGAFSLAERVISSRQKDRDLGVDEVDVRHTMFTVAAFVAFISFYAFAGAPTLRLIPAAPYLFQILVVATATLFLARRFARRQRAFAEETLARQIIRRWEWADMKPPKDLHEAFLIHTIRSQTHASGYARLLEIYKEAVREGVASGFISRAEVQRLESLRNQLQISQADHEKIMADLDEEERAKIANPALHVTAEKRLQLDSYASSLQSYLQRVSKARTAPDDSVIRHLRQEYGVTPGEHGAVLNELLGKGEGLAPQVAEAFAVIEGSSHTLQLLRAAPSAAGDFLADALMRRRARVVDGLMRGFGSAPEDEKHRPLRDQLISDDEQARAAAVVELGGSVAHAIGARLGEARSAAAREAATLENLPDAVRRQLTSVDPYVRVAALYLLDELSGADVETLVAMIRDEHEVVSETALCLRLRAANIESRADTGLVTVEKMIALRAVPLFVRLAPEDLASLARASSEKVFAPGQPLCVEGEPGDEVFVLLSGAAKVYRQDGDQQKLVGSEQAGGFIGEMAVLDPAPRAATVLAGAEGTRVLSLDGRTFREALTGNPSVAHGVIRALATRLRKSQSGPKTQQVSAVARKGP
ncbi:MAG TPA: cyclic nucleotide-binding domain-containing protein [Terriglobia bacterium]|nr:cyclic nucleotide-binding domain-containing protein [Terriglobia bacterium]